MSEINGGRSKLTARHLTTASFFQVMTTEHFINDGSGWACRRCFAETERARTPAEDARARFFSEGEAEHREAHFSNSARARWRDAARHTLFCPRCGAEEKLMDED